MLFVFDDATRALIDDMGLISHENLEKFLLSELIMAFRKMHFAYLFAQILASVLK